MNREPEPKEQTFLEVFQEVTRMISMVHEPRQVMDLVVRRLPGLLEADAATIRLFDSGTGGFVLGAAHGVSDEYLARSTIDSAEVISRLMAGRPTARSCVGRGGEAMSREGIKSIISLPILSQRQVIGMLRLLCKKDREYSPGEIDFAMALAEQVGIALANCRMFEELSSQVKFLRELREISRLVNSTLNLEQILSAIVEKLPALMKVKGCTIRLLQSSSNLLELVAASGLSERYLRRGPVSREDATFKVMKGEPVAIHDAATDPRVDYHQAICEEGIRSILAVPVRDGREVIGVLRLLSAAPRIFSGSEIDYAVTVAEEGGKAIQKARTYRQITLLFNQIEEHERFLQTIVDSLWLQLLAVSPDKRVVLANRMFLETNGFSEAEILGLDYFAVSPWAKAGRENCPLDQVLTGGAPVALLDSFDTGRGVQWIERHLTPIADAGGRIECVIEVVRDVTGEKMLENEKLARMKLEGIVEMAGTAAHELNTPLFAALGAAELLEEETISREGREDLALLIRNLRELSRLTREMTAITGFESRQYVGDTRIVALKGS